MHLKWSVLIAVSLGAGVLGCSPGLPPAIDVLQGTVLYDNVRVWQGQVTLLGKDNRVAVASLQPDGTFRVEHPPLGLVRIGVANYPQSNHLASGSSARIGSFDHRQAVYSSAPASFLELPSRYADPLDSGLTVHVEPGESQVVVHLQRGKNDPPAFPRPTHRIGVEVGDLAPEISGPDLDGQTLRLSEQRGKVVALLFWGHW